MKYQCPKCKMIIESSKRLEYCICGGKLYIPFNKENIYKMFSDLKMYDGSETLAEILARKDKC